VTLALRIFNDFVTPALVERGSKHNILHWHDVSLCIKIISTWLDVVNVKTPMKVLHKKSLLTATDQTRKRTETFLTFLFEWLVSWEEIPSDCRKLRREPFSALCNTSYGLLKVADYCLSELGLIYVLLGMFQTDCLEARFGQYLQLPGGKYNISYGKFMKVRTSLAFYSKLKLQLRKSLWHILSLIGVSVPNDSTEQLALLCDDDFLKVDEYYL